MKREEAWHPTARRVFDIDRPYFIFSTVMRCQNQRCRRKTVASSEFGLSLLPRFIQLAFPAELTQRSGLDNSWKRIHEALADTGVGPFAISEIMKELYSIRYDTLKLQYYGSAYATKKSPHSHFRAQGLHFLPFSSFKDTSGYSGCIPSGTYFSKFSFIAKAITVETHLWPPLGADAISLILKVSDEALQ